MLNGRVLAVTTLLIGMGLAGGAIADTFSATPDEAARYHQDKFHISCVLYEVFRFNPKLTIDDTLKGTRSVVLSFDLKNKAVQETNPTRTFVIEKNPLPGSALIFFQTPDHLAAAGKADSTNSLQFDPTNGVLSYSGNPKPAAPSDLYNYQCHPA